MTSSSSPCLKVAPGQKADREKQEKLIKDSGQLGEKENGNMRQIKGEVCKADTDPAMTAGSAAARGPGFFCVCLGSGTEKLEEITE